MAFLRDIPDDTPENTVKNILLILEEEADEVKAAFQHTAEHEYPVTRITADISQGQRNFRFFVSYADSDHLHETSGRIGIGFIAADQERYDLELIPGSWGTLDAPFRWEMSTSPGFQSSLQTPCLLDGSLLRQLLKSSLSSLPPESQ